MERRLRMRQFTIKAPISVEIGVRKKKKYYLNLNIYRNKVGFLMNNTKIEFKRIVGPLIPDVYYEKFEVEYELFLPDTRHRDISNVLSIVDKYFCDVFVGLKGEKGHAPDDSYHYLEKVTYKLGGFDEEKVGYVNITVKEVE